jgi:hypothetical protein
MRGDQMGMLAQMGRDRGDHVRFHGAHVGHDGARLQRGTHLLSDRLVRADGRAKNHQIRARGGGRRGKIFVAEAERLRASQDFWRGVSQNDRARGPDAPSRPGDRGSDQPDADDGDAIENGFGQFGSEPIDHDRSPP